MNDFHREIHKKYIIKIKNKEYCKKCDFGYLETLNLSEE